MYQSGLTIKDALDAMSRNIYVLPAIQREFVWKPDQICRLFDSLMQGYPFGTFLFWKVEQALSASRSAPMERTRTSSPYFSPNKASAPAAMA